MPSPSATEFKALFPQWASTADDDVERWLAQAGLRFMARKFGAQWSMAAYLYTAHQLQLFNPDASDPSEQHVARGPVTSDRVGDVARSYGTTVDLARVPASLTWLTSTTYGQQLIGIILSRNASRGRVVRTGASFAGIDTTTTT